MLKANNLFFYILTTVLISGSYFVLDSFAQNSEESLGSSMLNTTSIIVAVFVVLIIPVIIILAIMKSKEKLTRSQFKKTLIGAGLLFLVLVAVGISSSAFMTDEEKARMEAEREQEKYLKRQQQILEESERIEQQRQEEQKRLERFDPVIVASAKENFSDLQSLPRSILQQCRSVNSYEDYQVFGSAVVLTQDELTDGIEASSLAIGILESSGYDQHPEIGPMIQATKDLYTKASECMNELVMLYG